MSDNNIQPPTGQPYQPGPGENMPGYPADGTPPPKKRNWFARHKILTGLGAIVLIAGIASATSGGNKSTDDAASTAGTSSAATTSSTGSSTEATTASSGSADTSPAATTTTTTRKDSAPGIGTPVRDGKFEFTVTKVKTGVASVGDEYLGSKAQGQYVLVSITVKNIGDKAQTMFDNNQTVTDEQGRQFDADSTAEIYMKNNDVWMKDVNPGNSASGTLVYDMPKDAVPASIELHDSMFSGGVKVSLK